MLNGIADQDNSAQRVIDVWEIYILCMTACRFLAGVEEIWYDLPDVASFMVNSSPGFFFRKMELEI